MRAFCLNKSRRNSSKTNFIRLKAKSTCALFMSTEVFIQANERKARDANQVMAPQNACHSPPTPSTDTQNEFQMPCGLFK